MSQTTVSLYYADSHGSEQMISLQMELGKTILDVKNSFLASLPDSADLMPGDLELIHPHINDSISDSELCYNFTLPTFSVKFHRFANVIDVKESAKETVSLKGSLIDSQNNQPTTTISPKISSLGNFSTNLPFANGESTSASNLVSSVLRLIPESTLEPIAKLLSPAAGDASLKDALKGANSPITEYLMVKANEHIQEKSRKPEAVHSIPILPAAHFAGVSVSPQVKDIVKSSKSESNISNALDTLIEVCAKEAGKDTCPANWKSILKNVGADLKSIQFNLAQTPNSSVLNCINQYEAEMLANVIAPMMKLQLMSPIGESDEFQRWQALLYSQIASLDEAVREMINPSADRTAAAEIVVTKAKEVQATAQRCKYYVDSMSEGYQNFSFQEETRVINSTASEVDAEIQKGKKDFSLLVTEEAQITGQLKNLNAEHNNYNDMAMNQINKHQAQIMEMSSEAHIVLALMSAFEKKYLELALQTHQSQQVLDIIHRNALAAQQQFERLKSIGQEEHADVIVTKAQLDQRIKAYTGFKSSLVHQTNGINAWIQQSKSKRDQIGISIVEAVHKAGIARYHAMSCKSLAKSEELERWRAKSAAVEKELKEAVFESEIMDCQSRISQYSNKINELEAQLSEFKNTVQTIVSDVSRLNDVMQGYGGTPFPLPSKSA